MALFRDSISICCPVVKTVVAARDGYMEYLGFELKDKIIGGIPEDNWTKLYKVFRKPETIDEIVMQMQGVPLTNDHVEGRTVPLDKIEGEVITAKKIMLKGEKDSTCGVECKITLNDTMLEIVKAGKNELSLGYDAKLKPSTDSRYDFEQFDIKPYELAVVPEGRGGSSVNFKDKKKQELKEMGDPSKNQEGTIDEEQQNQPTTQEEPQKDEYLEKARELSLKDIADLIVSLKQAMTTIALEEIQEQYAPTLLKMRDRANELSEKSSEQNPSTDEDIEGQNKPIKDNESENVEENSETKKYSDADMVKMVNDAKDMHLRVVLKARNVLGANYNFEGKTTEQIMSDALATQYNPGTFKDSEISTAFKMLKVKEQNTKIHTSDSNIERIKNTKLGDKI